MVMAKDFLRTSLSGGNEETSMLLKATSINYDALDEALRKDPSLIKGIIRCNVNGTELTYIVYGQTLHRDLQSMETRAWKVLCYALPPYKFEKVVEHFGRNKRKALRKAYVSFHNTTDKQ